MGGGFVPNIKIVKLLSEGFHVGMGELVRMKTNAYMARGDDKDMGNFMFFTEQDGGDRGGV